jgi:hypothetical protein
MGKGGNDHLAQNASERVTSRTQAARQRQRERAQNAALSAAEATGTDPSEALTTEMPAAADSSTAPTTEMPAAETDPNDAQTVEIPAAASSDTPTAEMPAADTDVIAPTAQMNSVDLPPLEVDAEHPESVSANFELAAAELRAQLVRAVAQRELDESMLTHAHYLAASQLSEALVDEVRAAEAPEEVRRIAERVSADLGADPHALTETLLEGSTPELVAATMRFLVAPEISSAHRAAWAAMPVNERTLEHYARIHDRHFAPDATGSRFEDMTLQELLVAAANGRGLDRDDRQLFLEDGAPADAFIDSVRYLRVQASGVDATANAEDLPDDTPIVIAEQGGQLWFTAPSLVPRQVNFGTIVITDNDTSNSLAPQLVLAAYPGAPTDPTAGSVFAHSVGLHDGQTLTLGDLKQLLGRDDLILQATGQPQGDSAPPQPSEPATLSPDDPISDSYSDHVRQPPRGPVAPHRARSGHGRGHRGRRRRGSGHRRRPRPERVPAWITNLGREFERSVDYLLS